ncbi:MAG: DUF5693 family protein [Bacillota bacterium]|nr:DUF5693 family protein [Bacillota bacterium]
MNAANTATGGMYRMPRPARALWRAGLALLAAALVLSLPYLGARWSDEARTYRHVAVALDLEEWADLANAHGGDLRAWLEESRAAGIGILSLKEVRVRRLELEGRVTLYDPSTAAEQPAGLPFAPVPGHVYLRADDPAVFDLLTTNLPLGLDGGAVTASAPWMQVRAEAKTVRDVRTGFSPFDLALAAELGYSLMLRPANAPGIAPADRFPAEAAPGTVVMFQGSDILGFPDRIAETAAVMRERGLIFGVLETPVQLGLYEQQGITSLLQEMDYAAVRVHAFTEAELKKLLPDDLVDRSIRAVRDRGIGILYLKAVPPQVEQTAWAGIATRSRDYYHGLVKALREQRYTLAPPIAQRVPDARWTSITGLLGAVGGLLIVLGALVSLVRVGRRTLNVLASLAIAAPLGGAFAARLLGGRLLGLEALALMVSLSVPAAAAAVGMRLLLLRGGCPWRRGLVALAAMTAVGLAGGLLVAGTLGGPVYTLEYRYFRGVKAAHVVPPLIALGLGVLALWREREQERERVRELGRAGGRGEGGERGEGRLSLAKTWSLLAALGRSPVTWFAAAGAAVAGLGLMLILGRSGHTAGFEVSSVEVALRDLFDVRLFARPRFKELFLGHPAVLFLSVFHLLPGTRQDWLFPFGLAAAVISEVSIVNSFSHIRTPLVVSLIRSLNGLWTGIVLAAVAYAALIVLFRVCRWVVAADLRDADAAGPVDA